MRTTAPRLQVCLIKRCIHRHDRQQQKIAALFAKLTAQGASEEQLSTVYTPIGLDIGGETPEEIAVSIMAQIQQVRYDAPGGHLKGKDK